MAEAPWMLVGECVLAWARRPAGGRAPLPAPLLPIPGPAAVVAARYDDSPVGPYRELSVAEPARLGLRPALCVTTMVVTSRHARLEARRRWGLPAQLGSLRWCDEGDERLMAWDEGDVTVRGRPWGPTVPGVALVRSVQRGDAGPVVVPRRFTSRMRLAAADVAGDEGGPLGWAVGRHPGAVMAGVRVVVRPARAPVGLVSSVPGRALPVPGQAATISSLGRMAQLVRAQPSHG